MPLRACFHQKDRCNSAYRLSTTLEYVLSDRSHPIEARLRASRWPVQHAPLMSDPAPGDDHKLKAGDVHLTHLCRCVVQV